MINYFCDLKRGALIVMKQEILSDKNLLVTNLVTENAPLKKSLKSLSLFNVLFGE